MSDALVSSPIRRASLLACIGLAVACSTTPPNDSGYLGSPVALTIAQSLLEPDDGGILFIANAAGADLRAFIPRTHRFIRSPNAISPDIISLQLTDTAGNVVLPGFRPNTLASGTTGASGQTLGYVIVGGAANRVAVVDTQTLETTQGPADQKMCAAAAASTDAGTPDAGADAGVDGGIEDAGVIDAGLGSDAGAGDAGAQDAGPPTLGLPIAPSCMGASALAVATNSVNAFALLSPVNGRQSIAVFTPGVRGSAADGGVEVVLDPALNSVSLPAGGTYTSLTVTEAVNIGNTGVHTHAYVGDRANPRVLDVLIDTGAFTPIPTDGPISGVVQSPEYVNDCTGSDFYPCPGDLCPQGQFIFGILVSGGVDILDPIAHEITTITAPGSGVGDAGIDGGVVERQAPLMTETGVGVNAIAFTPCNTVNPPTGQCILRTASDSVFNPEALGFAALADGTTISFAPNDPHNPQIWSWTNVSSTPAPTVSTILYSDPLAPPSQAPPLSLSIPSTSVTMGITRDEAFQFFFESAIPGLFLRVGTLTESDDGGFVTLTDTGAGFGDFADAGSLQTGVGGAIGDVANLNPLNDPACAALGSATFAVTSIGTDSVNLVPIDADAGTVVPLPCSPLPAQAQYTMFSGEPTPWLLTSNIVPIVGRYANKGPGQVITVRQPQLLPGTDVFFNPFRFFYQTPESLDGTLCGPTFPPGGGQAFEMEFSSLMNPSDKGANFFWSTTSGFLANVIADPTLSAASGGEATALASTNEFLYIAVEGGNALEEAFLPGLTEADSIIDYH